MKDDDDEKKRPDCVNRVQFLRPIGDHAHLVMVHNKNHEPEFGIAHQSQGDEGMDGYDYAVVRDEDGFRAITKDEVVARGLGRSRPSTPEYRDGWDRIFGGKTKVGSA